MDDKTPTLIKWTGLVFLIDLSLIFNNIEIGRLLKILFRKHFLLKIQFLIAFYIKFIIKKRSKISIIKYKILFTVKRKQIKQLA